MGQVRKAPMVGNQGYTSPPRLDLSLRCELEVGQSPGCPQPASSAAPPAAQASQAPASGAPSSCRVPPAPSTGAAQHCTPGKKMLGPPAAGGRGAGMPRARWGHPPAGPATSTDPALMPVRRPRRAGTAPGINRGFGAERQSLVTGTWTHRHTETRTRRHMHTDT